MPRPAKFAGICGRCHEQIRPGEPVVKRRDYWMHADCASGQDDE